MNQEVILPSHLGIVLDGNRRWAKDHGLSSFEGHLKGYETFREVTKYAFSLGIDYVSAFVFSTENWQRTKDEVKFLLDLALRLVSKDLAELDRENVKIVWLGSKDRLSKRLIKAIIKAEELTKNNTHGTLCLCFNYGGQQEIVDAVKSLIDKKVPAEKVTSELVEQSLYVPDIPALDLMIRTSGEHRTSGFMLYRAAYSELYFTNKHWPDFSKEDLDLSLKDYSTRTRRFGK